MDFLGCECSSGLLLVCGLVLLIYLYGKWRVSVFNNTGIPGPPPHIYIGNMRLLAKEGLYDLNSRLRKQYGDVIGLYLGSIPVVVVYDLEILKEIFVKNFQNFTDRLVVDLNPYPVDKGLFFEKGLDWQRLRNILSPTFTGGKLRHMCDHMNTASRTLTNKLVNVADKQQTIDVKEYFGGFTMDTIASTAFGIQVDSQEDPNNPFVANAKILFSRNFFQQPLSMLATVFPSCAPLLRAFGVYNFPKDAVQFFMKTVHQMIEERKVLSAEGQKNNNDFLQLMMNAEDTTAEIGHTTAQIQKKNLTSSISSKIKYCHDDRWITNAICFLIVPEMTTTEIFAQAFLFFAAGYETTATTLQFTSYALATNPDVQQKLIDEIDSVIGDDEATYDNIQKLKYLDNVMQESLRLYPPVPIVTRQAAETVTIKGYTFPKDSYVLVPILQIHRDPQLFPEPEKFNPDRWDGAEKNHISWLPFGFGPRMCIGMRLAQVELKIALIHILRRVRFVRLPDTPDTMTFRPGGTLAPQEPLKVGVEVR